MKRYHRKKCRKFKKGSMSTVDWNLITQIVNPYNSYNIFINTSLKIYDGIFPIQKITMETRNLDRSWITTRNKKPSRKKQRLYEKFLKSKTTKTLETYKRYKNLFEKKIIKANSRNVKIISKLLENYEKKYLENLKFFMRSC